MMFYTRSYLIANPGTIRWIEFLLMSPPGPDLAPKENPYKEKAKTTQGENKSQFFI